MKSYADWLEATWEKKTAPTEEESSSHRMEHGIGAVGGGKGNGFGNTDPKTL